MVAWRGRGAAASFVGMNLSPRQIELVRSTFTLLEPKASVAVLAYYQKLCALNPALRAQLQSHLDDESARLMALWRAAADFADQPGRLRAMLAKPGRGCASYDAGGAYHAESGEALLWSLATTLGKEFTPEARGAWAALHSTMGELARSHLATERLPGLDATTRVSGTTAGAR